jgi:hypothetical protein
MRFDVVLAPAPADKITLALAPRPSAAVRALRDGWLGR